MSAATHVETTAVVDANRDPALGRLNDLLATAVITVGTRDRERVEIGRKAHHDFGNGSTDEPVEVARRGGDQHAGTGTAPRRGRGS